MDHTQWVRLDQILTVEASQHVLFPDQPAGFLELGEFLQGWEDDPATKVVPHIVCHMVTY